MSPGRMIVCAIVFLLCAIPAYAHKPSDSYLSLQVNGDRIEGQWDIALRDLDFVLGLDANGNGAITWDEVRHKHADIAAYALSRLDLSSEGKVCPLKAVQHLIDSHTDGTYEVLRFSASCAGPIRALKVAYSLFLDVDPQHRGLLNLASGDRSTTGVFSPERSTQTLVLAEPDKMREFGEYLRNGIWHIWIGFDHILFLISLLLPAVLELQEGKWRPAARFKDALLDVLKIVTAFTLAHSLTLTLATLQVISLPSRWVESAIALSVIVAALNNLFPVVRGRRWIAAFLFGLIHGFGFASVLTDLGLPNGVLVVALVGFNLGVEIGQLTIVTLFLPLAYLMRSSWFYRRIAFAGGSTLILLLASIWLIERAFNLRLISA
jgi:hypothetical protein